MLTNERLNELSKLNGLEVADTLTPNEALSMARELLTLREATAPSRAEVDECFQNYNGNYTREQMCDVPRLESITRTAIIACEREKQRADEAEKEGREEGVAGIMQAMNAQCLTINQQEKIIATLTAERDEVMGLLTKMSKWYKAGLRYDIQTEGRRDDVHRIREIVEGK